MNRLIKAASRLNNFRAILHPIKDVVSANGTQNNYLARNLWYMCNLPKDLIQKPAELSSCGCGKIGIHSKAESDLVHFLSKEIATERKAQKSKTIPAEIDGFQVKLNGTEVTLTKNDSVTIRFNVNHSMDIEDEPEMNPLMNKANIGEFKSKPTFKVDLVRGDTIVSLQCSFIKATEEDGFNDVFGIDEISIFNGDWNEQVYAVSGEVVDSYLYDLLLNYLEEKGISNEFVEKISEYSTAYEHSAYIGLLEGLSKFASGK